MNFRTLIVRSLSFHARSHIGVILGAAVGAAVLIGALIVGDSVRSSLREMALKRLGKIDHAMVTNDRLFREQLAEDMGGVPVLMLPGVAVNSDSEIRADRVQVVGINEAFWDLADAKPRNTKLAEDQLLLNEALAERLGAKVGDSVSIRVPKISSLSRDAPMATQDDDTAGMRFTVTEIVSSEQLGRFSLQANQIPPYNAFISLARMQERANATNRANLMLVSGAAKKVSQHWRLEDADLQLRALTNSPMTELRSPRVFLDPPVVAAAARAFPEAAKLQTYFVNSLKVGQNEAFYSMVTAAGPPWVPSDMQDDEILVNKLLASDIESNPGTRLTLTYNVVGHARKMEEHTKVFTVRGIVDMGGIYQDSSLMPDFPGMTDAESCRDWDTGMDVGIEKLSNNEQDYWDRYRGTPKAYVTAAAGAKMWNNRFGQHTAVRVQGTNVVEIEKTLLATLDPAAIGFVLQPLREQALDSSKGAQDFGGLFIGFSFFLITAALILVSMLFQFSVEQRSKEVGTLLAIGYEARQVRNLLLGEGVGLAAIGSAIGLVGGIWYAQAMLHGLSTIWRDAVGTSELAYHAGPATLIGGLFGAIAVAAFSLWLALRKQVAQPARELLAENDSSIAVHDRRSGAGKRNFYIGAASFAGALGLTAWAFTASESAKPGAFFGAGALLLIAALCFTGMFLSMLENAAGKTPSLGGLGVRNISRRRRRSMATAIMLACGCFLVLSIGAFRLDENLNATERDSGTGGFLFLGDASVPIRPDLNTDEGKEFLGMDPEDLPDVNYVQMRVRPGDDASCLNLNKAHRPRILGVNPAAFSERKAFRFAKTIEATEDPWSLLKMETDDGAIPAIGDNASLMWAMKSGVGKIIEYPDLDERGQKIRFRIVGGVANSILQGNLIIDEDAFAARFPSQEGYRSFLIDGPTEQADTIKKQLTRDLRDNGLELTRATRRLAQFNAVQNTYLGTFQILGGLGLLLGSAGLGVVVLRNVLERRGEFAVMMALGFRSGALKRLVVVEHVALLLLGLVSGIGAAIIAVIPALQAPASDLPYDKLSLTLAGVLFSGIIFTWLASVWALRGKILDSLRNN